MKNIKLVLAYDGTDYLGWQKTRMGPSIEETLEKALRQVLQENVTLQAASRTDAGVHAKGQVVNFFTTKGITLHQINCLLPDTISALSIEEVPEAFHPTLDAIGKEYHYHVCLGTVQLPTHRHISWHVHSPLHLDLMQKAAKQFKGTHNFSAFCNCKQNEGDESYVREICEIEIVPLADNRLQFRIVGANFLYKMVRNLVGTLTYIGRGKIPLDRVSEILANQDRTQAGITAPAHGLTLHRVFYKDRTDHQDKVRLLTTRVKSGFCFDNPTSPSSD